MYSMKSSLKYYLLSTTYWFRSSRSCGSWCRGGGCGGSSGCGSGCSNLFGGHHFSSGFVRALGYFCGCRITFIRSSFLKSKTCHIHHLVIALITALYYIFLLSRQFLRSLQDGVQV